MTFGIRRPCVRLARAALFGTGVLRSQIFRSRQGSRVVFLPAYGRKGAALLRIHNMADLLRERGYDTHLIHSNFTLTERRWWLARLRPDLVVMQGTRHPLNRPALYPGLRIVLDLDDADFHLPRFAPSLRSAMAHVVGVMAGSRYIAEWCRGAGVAETHVVWTGTKVSRAERPPQSTRGPVVAWAQTRPMSYRHEAALLRPVLARVAERHPGVTLRLYDRRPGDDLAFAESFAAPGLSVEWYPQAGYEAFLASFDDVAVGLAPLVPEDPFCRAKSFGKLLAYLDRKVPVVASDFGEPREFFNKDAGALCSRQEEWVAAISGLLSDPSARQAKADAAFRAFQRQLSAEAAATRMAQVLDHLSDTPDPWSPERPVARVSRG